MINYGHEVLLTKDYKRLITNDGHVFKRLCKDIRKKVSYMLLMRQEIQNILKTKCLNVFYENGSKPYPYVIFEIAELTHESGKHCCQLEINVIDYGKDSSLVEHIADEIESILDSNSFNTPLLHYSVFKISRKLIKEEDKEIKRRRLLFELNYYTKGE